MKLIEAYGTGILKIKESYSDCAAKPRFEVTDNAFKIMLPNINFTERRKEMESVGVSRREEISNRHKTVLRLAKKQGTIVRKDVESELGVSQATAILVLRQMLEKGLLVKEGSGKYQSYRIAG